MYIIQSLMSKTFLWKEEKTINLISTVLSLNQPYFFFLEYWCFVFSMGYGYDVIEMEVYVCILFAYVHVYITYSTSMYT